jgi:hypothetical protein
MGGMSEFTMMLEHYGIDWRLGYLLFSVAMVILSPALDQQGHELRPECEPLLAVRPGLRRRLISTAPALSAG